MRSFLLGLLLVSVMVFSLSAIRSTLPVHAAASTPTLSINPSSQPLLSPGSTVTISGLNFSGDAGLTHVAFDVVDIFAEYERLKKAGVKFHTEPQVVGTFRATYGRDADGNIFELQEVMDPKHPVSLSNLVPNLAKA